jgi:NAD(P)-dependent dehydrogenase (short-subunit alcohol dehydrogenase family)
VEQEEVTADRLAGRTAIVTGASRGIGLAAAAALHEDGANVVLTSRTEEAAVAAASSVGHRAIGIGAHATDEAAARECVARTIEVFGTVDILVNNAGTNPAHGPVLSQDHSRFSKTMDVNLWAPILWSQLAVEAWMGEHGGSIVNTASISGMLVAKDLGIYDVSKAALIHLTKQLAVELGPDIRVNAVAPGVVRTRLAEALWKEQEDSVADLIPLRRIGDPDDVGAAVAFLASPDASWITGETLVIDGGQMIGSGAAADAFASGVGVR